VPVAEKAIMADALEAVWQDVQQKAPQKLIGRQGHQLVLVFVLVIFVGEGDLSLCELLESVVGDGDARTFRVSRLMFLCAVAGAKAVRSAFTVRIKNSTKSGSQILSSGRKPTMLSGKQASMPRIALVRNACCFESNLA
jgi:hypothetical protein